MISFQSLVTILDAGKSVQAKISWAWKHRRALATCAGPYTTACRYPACGKLRLDTRAHARVFTTCRQRDRRIPPLQGHTSIQVFGLFWLCACRGLAPQWSATRYGGPGYSSGPIKSFSASKSQAKALEPPLRSYTPGRGAFLPWRVRRGYRFHNLLKTCQKKSRPGRSPQVFVKSAGNPEDFDILAAASR